MRDQRRAAALRAALRMPRRTVRLRLTLLAGGLFLASGAGLLAVTYALIAGTFPVATTYTRSGGGPRERSRSGADLAGLAAAARQRQADLHALLAEYAVALAVLAVVSFALGWLVAGRALRPLREITAAARRISASRLHERLDLRGPDDEVKELGDTFDGLLGRLERSFASQRQFVANASHELRTPLTLECVLLEAALTDPSPTSQAWRSTCESVLAAGRHQERLIEALLTLARSEAGLDRREPVDLAEVAGQVLAARRDAARTHELEVTASLAPAPVAGDPRLVERLVANVLDNAIRHNVPRGRIEVATGLRHGHAVLSVGNTGFEIPGSELGQIFRPFRRARTDRAGHDGGYGLGLSIVQAVATAHAATVSARPRPGGGLDLAVRFPARGPRP